MTMSAMSDPVRSAFSSKVTGVIGQLVLAVVTVVFLALYALLAIELVRPDSELRAVGGNVIGQAAVVVGGLGIPIAVPAMLIRRFGEWGINLIAVATGLVFLIVVMFALSWVAFANSGSIGF